MGLQSIGTLGFASQVLNAVPSPHLSQEQVYVLQATSVQGTGLHVVSCLVSPEVVSGRCAVGKCV